MSGRKRLLSGWERKVYHRWLIKRGLTGQIFRKIISNDWVEGLVKPRKYTFELIQTLAEVAARYGSVKMLMFAYECHAQTLRNKIQTTTARAIHTFANPKMGFPIENILVSAAQYGQTNVMKIAIVLGANNFENAIITAATHKKVDAMRLACAWLTKQRSVEKCSANARIATSFKTAVSNGDRKIISIYEKYIEFSHYAIVDAIRAAAKAEKIKIVNLLIKKFPTASPDGISQSFLDAAENYKFRLMKRLLKLLDLAISSLPYSEDDTLKKRTLSDALMTSARRPNHQAMKIAKWLHARGATVTQEQARDLREYVSDEDEDSRQKWQILIESCVSE